MMTVFVGRVSVACSGGEVLEAWRVSIERLNAESGDDVVA